MANILLNHVYKQYPRSGRNKGKNPFAVIDFNLEINDGEFVVFVGPSGCGKSTTLRMIAGLEDITSGDLYIDGVLSNNKEPKDRDIAMVFQSYALYPHKTAYGNIAFALQMRKYPFPKVDENGNPVIGIDEARIAKIEKDLNKLQRNIVNYEFKKKKLLTKIDKLLLKNKEDLVNANKQLISQIDEKIRTINNEINKAVKDLIYYKETPVQIYTYRHLKKDEIDAKIKRVADILDISQLLDRKPSDMSGGQRQRIALGRAMVRDPKAFLLDEPLSNLDAKLRTAMRSEIVKLHNQIKATFIYVTHDQIEAMTMGTKIVVMKDGEIMQIACPTDLYDYPKNKFVAGFIGTPQMNFFETTIKKNDNNLIVAFEDGQQITLSLDKLRPIKDAYLDGEEHAVYLGIRGEQMKIADSGLNVNLSLSEVLGTSTNLFVTLPGTTKEYIVTVNERVDYQDGTKLFVALDEKFVHLFDKDSEETITVVNS